MSVCFFFFSFLFFTTSWPWDFNSKLPTPNLKKKLSKLYPTQNKSSLKTSKTKLNAFYFLFLYNHYFFIIRNLHGIPSLGKSNLLTFLQNDFKKEIFHMNISLPFYYYSSIYSTLITLKARQPSFKDKKHVALFGILHTISWDQKKNHPNLPRRKM